MGATRRRQVALLRGVNLASRNRIAMADLRDLLAELGYEDVGTLLQSGNAMFATARRPERVATEIERAIADRFGLEIAVLVRTASELAGVVERNPFGTLASDPSRFLVTFLAGRPDPERLAGVDPAEYEPERFAVGEREIYVWHPNGLRDAKLGHAFWERRLGLTATGRNWNTVTKLLALAG
jgi:uncharacterized protein (DUF1697 family)